MGDICHAGLGLMADWPAWQEWRLGGQKPPGTLGKVFYSQNEKTGGGGEFRMGSVFGGGGNPLKGP